MKTLSKMKKLVLPIALAGAASLAATNASADVVTVTNGDSIAIPETGSAGPADPFPSTIEVVGEGGTIVDIDVLLFGVSHTWADDLQMVLVGPDSTAVYLWGEAGGGPTDTLLLNADITFDDEAAAPIPNGNDGFTPIEGSYQVSQYASPNGNVPGVYGTDLSAFDGLGLNGVWSLYVFDDQSSDVGSISQGWGLRITTSEIPIPGAIFLFAGGLAGLTRFARKKKTA